MPTRTWIVAVISCTVLVCATSCTHPARSRAAASAPPSGTPSAPIPAPPVSPVPTPVPASTATPTPTATPTVTATGERALPRTVLPPDWADLGNATLDLPSWGSADFCPHGRVRLTNGWFPDSGGTDWQDGIGSVVAVDLDGDGRTEAVARFDCERSDPGMEQVVGFGRTAAGGIRTLGIVVGPGNHGPADISDVIASGDQVSVSVDNQSGSSGSGVQAVLHQLRTYGWTGSAFHQTGGPTSFISNARISGRGGDLVFAAPVGGKLLGTMTVTLFNDGTTAVGSVALVAAVGDTALEPVDSPDCRAFGASVELCDVIGGLAPGHGRSVTLRFELPAADVGFLRGGGGLAGGGFQLQIWIGDQKTAANPTYGVAVLP